MTSLESNVDAAEATLNGRWRLDGTWEYHRPKKKLPRWLSRILIVIASFVGLYLAIVVGTFVFQNHLIYFPDRATPPPAAEVLPDAEDVTLHTADGLELGAWWATPPAHIENRNQVVLYAGGNAGNRYGRSPLVFFLTQRGFEVLSFDYRGFGGNPGSPSEEGLVLDAQAALVEVKARGFAPEQIIYFGESLGAAVVARLAVDNPPGGLVLRSPFTSLDAVASWHFPFLPTSLLLRDHFPVAELMPQVTAPVVVLYGLSDMTVPHQQSSLVARLSPTLVRESPWGAGHNDSMWWGIHVAETVVWLGDYLRALG